MTRYQRFQNAVVAAFEAPRAQRDDAELTARQPHSEVNGTAFALEKRERQRIEADRAAEEGSCALGGFDGRGGMLIPEESEAAARAEVAEGAARDVVVDDGDTALRPNAAEEAFGPGGLQGSRGTQQGNSERSQGGGLGLPVMKVGGEEDGGGAAVFPPECLEVDPGAGGQSRDRGAAEKQGKNVQKEVEGQFPAEKSGVITKSEGKIATHNGFPDPGKPE